MGACWIDIYSLRSFELKSRNDFIEMTIEYNIINRHLWGSEAE